MLKDEEKLEQDKTDEVKASSSLVSVTESADKDLVEKDIKEETADESQAAQTDNSESITDKDNSESADNQNTQSADSKVAEHQIKEKVTETSISYKDAVSDDAEICLNNKFKLIIIINRLVWFKITDFAIKTIKL